MTNLVYLYLFDNDLYGRFLYKLGMCQAKLCVLTNTFSGSVPSEQGMLNIGFLSLDTEELSGALQN